MDFGDFFIPEFFYRFFSTLHQTPAAHRLKIATLSNSPIILSSYTIV
jgi:hypothetical protein